MSDEVQGEDQSVINQLHKHYNHRLAWQGLSRCDNLLARMKRALPEHEILPHRVAFILKILIEHAVAHAVALAGDSDIEAVKDRAVNCKAIPSLLGLVGQPGQYKRTRWEQVAKEINASVPTVRRHVDDDTYFRSLLEAIDGLLNDSEETKKFVRSAALKRISITGDATAQETNEVTTKKPGDKQSDIATPNSSDSILARLRNLSAQLAAELDVSSGQGIDGEPHRLSGGLYVRRLKQDVVRDVLRSDKYDRPIIVSGLAGEGKSSLLWDLHRELGEDDHLESFFIDSLWLVASDGQVPILTHNELRDVTADVTSRGQKPIFLIDTVDLLLHHPVHRQHLLDICDALGDADARVVITSRPDEAQKLPPGLFQKVELQPYHETLELPQAVKQHVAVFCPEAAPLTLEAKIQSIIKATVNGLPVKEVVLNPLKFRLLFELYGGEFPPLDELDAARLNAAYWRRRVINDQRSEVTIVSGEDLSRPAEQIAIALLAGGRPSLGEDKIVASAASVADDWHGEAVSSKEGERSKDHIRKSIATLSQRGILVRSLFQHELSVRFYHQIAFEYAAALGLLFRDGGLALQFLIEHMSTHPDDLFIGAVLEQMLIIGANTPIFSADVVSALTNMADSLIVSLQRIALAAVAYHPNLVDIAKRLIHTVEPAALRRYVQTAPTVAGIDVSQQVANLVLVWHQSIYAREAVLEAFERLGMREPAVVLTAIRKLECVKYALDAPDPARLVKLVGRVLAASGGADRAWAGKQLLALFDAMVSESNHRNVALFLLDLIAKRWSVIGSDELAAEIQAQVLRAQAERDAAAIKMRDALGRILALPWAGRFSDPRKTSSYLASDPDNEWLTYVRSTCRALEKNHKDVLANAQLSAISLTIINSVLDEQQTCTTLECLFGVREWAPLAVAGKVFPIFLASEGPVAQPVIGQIVRLLDNLPAPGSKAPEGAPRWACAARTSLHDADISAARLAGLLGSVPDAENVDAWFADDRLALLLAQAAAGGHATAQTALKQVTANVGLLSAVGQKNVSYDIVRQLPKHPYLVGLLIDLSVARVSSAPLCEVVIDPEPLLRAELHAKRQRLQKLVNLLFGGGGASQRDAASLWLRLYRIGILPSPTYDDLTSRLEGMSEPAASGNLLELATEAVIAGDLSRELILTQLQRRFSISSETATLTPNSDIAKTARKSWVRIICQNQPLDEMDTDALLKVTGAAPTDSGLLGEAGYLVKRFAESGRPENAVEVLNGISRQAVVLELESSKQENTLANNLRMAMRFTLRVASQDTRETLLRQIPELPRTYARILAWAASKECFGSVRSTLSDLLTQQLPVGVCQQIHDDIRVRSRDAAKSELPMLCKPLTAQQQSN